MNIRDVDDKGEIVAQPSEKPMESKSVESAVLPEIEAKSVASVLGIETDSEMARYQDKIGTLLEWAKQQTTDHSPESLKWAIRSLELKLGTPPLSEKRINYVARYAFLSLQERAIAKEKQQYVKSI